MSDDPRIIGTPRDLGAVDRIDVEMLYDCAGDPGWLVARDHVDKRRFIGACIRELRDQGEVDYLQNLWSERVVHGWQAWRLDAQELEGEFCEPGEPTFQLLPQSPSQPEFYDVKPVTYMEIG